MGLGVLEEKIDGLASRIEVGLMREKSASKGVIFEDKNLNFGEVKVKRVFEEWLVLVVEDGV